MGFLWGPLMLLQFHQANPQRWTARRERAQYVFDCLYLRAGNDAIARNRLVRGWIERTKSWDAGTLRRGAGADALEVFTLRRPTLIVMEEAGERPEEIRAAIDTLAASSDRLRQVVRVLLVEREKPPSLRSLDDERHARRHRFRRSPLQLGSLDDDALRALSGALERETGSVVALTAGHLATLHRATGGDEYLAIVALKRLAETGTIGWHEVAPLLAEQSSQLRARLDRLGLRQEHVPLLLLATIAGGLPWSDAQAFAPGVRLEVPVCERWLRAGCQRRIPPVTPPILGHFFVLDHLSSLTEIEHRRLMSAAWRTAPDRTSFTLASMHFALAGHSGLALLDRRPDEPELVEPWAEAQLILLLVPDADASARERRLDVLRELASSGEAERTRRLGRALATALARPMRARRFTHARRARRPRDGAAKRFGAAGRSRERHRELARSVVEPHGKRAACPRA